MTFRVGCPMSVKLTFTRWLPYHLIANITSIGYFIIVVMVMIGSLRVWNFRSLSTPDL